MSAPTDTPPRPASGKGAEMRLPWWALALPILAFSALLTLVLDPVHTRTDTAGPTAVTRFVGHIQQLIAH